MKKSEVLALQWKDINIFNQKLAIGKTLAMDEYNQKEWYFKFGYNTSKDT